MEESICTVRSSCVIPEADRVKNIRPFNSGEDELKSQVWAHEHRLYVGCSCAFCCLKERKIAYGKKENRFYLTIGMILILHLTACTNRSSELPAPDSTVFGYEGETKIIFDGVCAKYNDKKEKNQVFLPIVQVLGTYEEGNITKIVSCVSLTEMSLEEGNLTIAGTNIFPMVTEIKYENEEYEIINLNSAETVLANGSASFPEVFLLICGPLEDVKQDIENGTFALPEMEKEKSREREYIEWSNVNVSTVNGDINYDEYFRLAD